MPAISLGDVTFGLGADTKGLNKSIKVLNDFGRKVDSISAKQGAAASKTVTQMARQESAVRKALQQVLRLNQQIRQSGAPPELIARNTQAFGRLTRGLTSTNLSFKNQLRMQDRFQSQLGKSSRALGAFKTAKAQKGLKGMSNIMRDLESASVLAVGPLSGVGARIRAIGSIAHRSTLMVVGLLAGITGLLVAVFKLSAAALRARTEMDRINSVMMQATGSAFFARKEFEFVAQLADRMGQQVASTAASFAEFAAAARDTALEGQGVRDVFTGVLEAVTALKLPLETQKGLFRALIQMMSKGVIQSEELRGQFGERLAGGFELVRKEIGKTRSEFAKMLKTGALFAEKYVPAIGRAMHKSFEVQAAKAANTLESAINRLANAQLRFNVAMDEMLSASAIAIGVINTLTGTIDTLGANLDTVVASLGAVTIGMLVLTGPAILRGLKLLTGFMLTLNTATMANPFVFLTTVLLRLSVAIGASAVAFVLFNSMLDDSDAKTQALLDSTDDLLKMDRLRNDLQVKLARERLEVMNAEIAMIELRVKAQEAFVKSLEFGTELIDIDVSEEAEEKLDGLVAQLEEFREKAAGIIALLAKGVKPLGETGDDISDALQDAIDEVDDFAKALERSNKQIENLGKDIALDPAFLDAFFEAQDAIEDLSTEELENLKVKLEEVGFSSKNIEALAKRLKALGISTEGVTTTEAALAQLIFTSQQAGDAWKEFLKAFEKSPDVMEGINQQFDRMSREIAAMGRSAKAVDDLNDAFEREDAIEKYKEGLEKLTETTRKMVPTLEEFIVMFDNLKKAEVGFEKLTEVAGEFNEVMTSAFENAIIEGEGLRDVLKGIFEDLQALVLRKAVTEPLGNIIGDFFTGSGIGSIFGFAHGGRPPPGEPSVVGEQGAEVFVPDQAGTIIPNEELLRLMRMLRGEGGRHPEPAGTPTVSDVTTRSVHSRGIGAVLSMFGGGPVGLAMSSVTSGIFGKFGVTGGGHRPQVQTPGFAREVEAGRIASALNRMARGIGGRPGAVGSLGVGGGFAGGNLGGLGRAGGVGTPGVGGGFGGGPGGGPGAPDFGGGGDEGTDPDPGGELGGFGHGGSFTIGGTGGTDSQPVEFLGTPGERVTVETPGQQRDRGDTFNVTIDARGAALGVERKIMEVMSQVIQLRRDVPAISAATSLRGRRRGTSLASAFGAR